jgi:hypothetical protein
MSRAVLALMLLAALGIALHACQSSQRAKKKRYQQVPEPALRFEAGPPTLVYRTRADYDTLVPILLSEDKIEIISYPHPGDLRRMKEGKPALSPDYPYPTPLEGGYRLDNRGVGLQVAFLKLSYRAYAAREQAPSLAELEALILDRDPLTELCDCGNRQAFSDPVLQINKLIVLGRLKEVCRVLK